MLSQEPDKNSAEKEPVGLSEEQLKENQRKIDEYDRILRVIVTALGIMLAIIVCIVIALVANNS